VRESAKRYERKDEASTIKIFAIQTAAMATELPTTNGHNGAQDGENNFAVKAGLARMLKGGVIMDVINAEQVSYLLLYSFPSSLALLCWRVAMANSNRPA
jgi:hypothetical protein